MFAKILAVAAFMVLAEASLMHEPVHHHAPQPYKFGYDIKDKHSEQYRQEEGNGGHAVKGSYGFTDDRGVKRQVDYVADHGGFRAQVKTNEPGTANQNPAAVLMVSDAPYAGGVGLGYGGYGNIGYGGYGNAGYGNGGYGNAGYGYGGYGNAGYGYGGYGNAGYGNGGYGNAGYGYGGYGNAGYGYGGYGNAGYGYGGYGNAGYGYGGLGLGILGGLGYARYGY